MKKLASFCIMILLMFSFSSAESIFSPFSYDELILLSQALNAEIVSRPEWEGTTIPAGQWVIGKDIPAGTYSIRTDKLVGVTVWRKEVQNFTNGGMVFNELIDENNPYGKLKLETGWILEISLPITLAPPAALTF